MELVMKTMKVASLPPGQEQDLPYTGYYKDIYLRFTGADVQRGIDLRSGTVIPKEAIREQYIVLLIKHMEEVLLLQGKIKNML